MVGPWNDRFRYRMEDRAGYRRISGIGFSCSRGALPLRLSMPTLLKAADLPHPSAARDCRGYS